MNGRTAKRPVKVKVPEISEKTAESRFARRYNIAVDAVLDKVLMPGFRQIHASISRQIKRKNPRSTSEIDDIVDQEVQRYIKQNPGSFASLYLKEYDFPYRHEGSDYPVNTMSISLFRDKAQHNLVEAALELRYSGKPFHPNNIWGILRPGSEQKSVYFVDHNSFEGALAVQIADEIDRFLRADLSEFKYAMSRPKEQKPGIQMHIRAAKENKNKSRISFSRS